MPNILQAKKRVRQAQKRAERNKHHRSTLRTFEKKALKAIEDGAENADDMFMEAKKRFDRAAVKGRVHRNTAARHVSRLQRALNRTK